MPEGKRPTEFEIIARYLAPLAADEPGALALLDDAAFFNPSSANALVMTMDTLVAGIHFRAADNAADIAHKALAVNISDLAAKGAEPLVYLLSLALPGRPDPDWLEAFASGLRSAQEAFGCRLAGGDTVATTGPLTLTVTAIGEAGESGMIRRSTAMIGDCIYVTGSIGDAALGLALLQGRYDADSLKLDPADEVSLHHRYWRPEPRLAAIPVLRTYASAAMDISDGLVGDLTKLCEASGVGARCSVLAVPFAAAVQQALAADPSLLTALLTGGDDYEILATVPEDRSQTFEQQCADRGLRVTSIGNVVDAGDGITFDGPDGRPLLFDAASFDHFGS